MDKLHSAKVEGEGERERFIAGILSDLDGETEPEGWPRVPYPGLRSFTAREEVIFFGRDDDEEAVRKLLTDERCAIVLGGSGCGKSSLVRAGVVPKLIIGDPLHDRRGPWYALTLTPGNDPFESLAGAILSDIHGLSGLPSKVRAQSKRRQDAVAKAARQSLARLFNSAESSIDPSDRRGLQVKLTEFIRRRYQHDGEALADFIYSETDRFQAAFVEQKPSGITNLVIVVDQFEELFRRDVDTKAAQTIVRFMARLGSLKRSGLYVIATMRSEEVYRSIDYPELTGLIDRAAHFVDLPSSGDLYKSITSPARNVLAFAGFGREDGDGIRAEVAEQMLQAVGALTVRRAQRADQLPLLQNALRKLWRYAAMRWSQNPTCRLEITSVDLDRLPMLSDSDGVPDLAVCLNETADDAFAEACAALPRAIDRGGAKELLEIAFVRLERPDDRGNPARAFANAGDILEASGHEWPISQGDLDRSLTVFVRRTILSRRDENDGFSYDVSHEAVIRNWKMYTDWLDEANRIRSAIGRVLADAWEVAAKRHSQGTYFARWLAGVNGVGRVIGRAVKDVWNEPSERDLKTQFHIRWHEKIVRACNIISGELKGPLGQLSDTKLLRRCEYWTPSLSSKQAGVLISHDQSSTLKGVLAVKRFWRSQRGTSKFSAAWVAAAIGPMLERRQQGVRQFTGKDRVGDKIADLTQRTRDWLFNTIDKARREHFWRGARSVGIIALSSLVVFLIVTVWFFAAQLNASMVFESAFQVASNPANPNDSKADQSMIGELSRLIDGLEEPPRIYNLWFKMGNLWSTPIPHNLETYYRGIFFLDSTTRSRLGQGLQGREISNSEAENLKFPTASCSKGGADSLTVSSAGSKRGIRKINTNNGVPSYLPAVERNNTWSPAGTLADVFVLPQLAIWCLSPAADALLGWEKGKAPYVIPLQWASYSVGIDQIRWLAKQQPPLNLALRLSADDVSTMIKKTFDPIYDKLDNQLASSPQQPSGVKVRNDDRTSFLFAGPGDKGIELSFVSPFREYFSSDISSDNLLKRQIASLHWECSDSSMDIEDCPIIGFEPYEEAMRYYVSLKTHPANALVPDLSGGSAEPELPCAPGTSGKSARGVCRYQLSVNFKANNTSTPILRFPYYELLSAPISAVAVNDGYLWLRQGTAEKFDVFRFDFSLARMEKALNALRSDDFKGATQSE
jgi:hypothetical protein